jgi:Xaa-Pro aminopeptidase
VLWITGLVNIRYLTGFTGSYAQLLISPAASYFFTDGRYQEQVQSEVENCEIHIFKNQTWPEVFAEQIGKCGWKKIGFEAKHLTVESLHKQRTTLDESLKWQAVGPWVEELRLVKDASEVDALQRSSQAVDHVFENLLPEFREGITENEVFRRLMNLLWEFGAAGPSFDPIVLFGPRSSLPHGKPGNTPLRKGDWVLLDFGALLDGYCSDCTRTFVFGEPTADQRKHHDLVMEAYQAGADAARPGASCKEVDSAARRVLAKAGMEEAFIHGLGHGVGLEIHEGPRLAQPSTEVLQEGNVVTIEPGIYLPGWGGIRLENAMVVTQACAQPLTRSSMGIQPWQRSV